MSPRHEDPDAVPLKPARWVSPWNFDDVWEIEEQRREPQEKPQPPNRDSASPEKEEVRAIQPQLKARQTPANTSTIAAKSPSEPQIVTTPVVASRMKSFESFGGITEPAAPPVTPTEAPATTTEPSADFSRFQPPPVKPVHFETAPAPEPRRAEPSQAKPTIPIEPTTPIPPRRPAPVPGGFGHENHASFSWGTPIVLCLGVLGLVLLTWIYLTDSPPEPDDDLQMSIPVDQAARIQAPERMKVFLDAVLRIENMELALKPAWTWDTPSLATYVRANGVAFDNLRDLLEDFDWHPHHAAWHAEDLGEHPSWPHVRILLQAQAAYLIRLANEEAALTTAIDLAEMSRRMQELWAWPSYIQRSQEMHMACVQTVAEILRQTRLSSQNLRRYQEEFLLCEPSDSVLQEALSAFYMHEKKLLFGEKSGVPLDTLPAGVTRERPARLFFKKQETLNLFAEALRQLRNEVVIAPYTSLDQPSLSTRNLRRSRPIFFQPNGAGATYFHDHMQLYQILPERHSLARARHSIVLSLFAIRCYVADHQKLPSSLADLSPKYLRDVPMDPFSGEPMQYDPLKGLLFSAGTNFIKEGGKVTQPPLLDPTEPTVDLGIAVATPVPVTK